MYKTCSRCSGEKLLTDFRRDRAQTSGYQSWCKVCARAQHKSAYMERYGDKARAAARLRGASTRQFIVDYKNTHPCIICGEDNRVCLDFHHLDPTQKDFNLSAATTSTRSIESIQEEIDKCVVLCKNCHMKVHNDVISLLIK